jgi:hypothetical protein
MTVGGIIFCVICTIFVIFLGVTIGSSTKPLAGILIAGILVAGIWGGSSWYYNNTASGARAIKDQQSEFNNGIERHIVVKDYSGGIIAEYEGKMDIETDNETYVLFDDEEGKRHIIYNTTGFILIDEI